MMQPSDFLLEIMGVKIQDFWTGLIGLSKSTRTWYFMLGILCIFYAILKTLNLANLLFLKYLSVVYNSQRKKGVMSPETLNIGSPWFITVCSALFEIIMVLNEGTYNPCPKLQTLQHSHSHMNKNWFLAVFPYLPRNPSSEVPAGLELAAQPAGSHTFLSTPHHSLFI